MVQYFKKILVILGPTSTSKTDLSLSLAKKFNGELVSCDSRQVYCGLDIGTGKLPNGRWKVENGRWKKGKGFWEMDGVKIWMYDVADFKKQYTVYDYMQDVFRVIGEIRERGKLPIIVGGTGFYLKVLLEGLPNLSVPVDRKLRKKLNELSLNELQIKLQRLSPEKWEKMNNSDRQNPRRLVRAIEIVILSTSTGSAPSITLRTSPLTTSSLSVNSAKELSRMRYSNKLRDSSLIVQNDKFDGCDILKIGLTASREVLYQRIDERVVSRINQGMIEEARKLHQSGLTFKRMRQLGLEYGVLADYLEGKIKSREELIKQLQGKIHGYARRQLTWFKKEKGVSWFDITDRNYTSKIDNLIIKWYDNEIGGRSGRFGRKSQ